MLNETQLKKLDGDIEQHNKAIEEAVVSITADDKRQRLFVLDNFLFDRLVEKHWAQHERFNKNKDNEKAERS